MRYRPLGRTGLQVSAVGLGGNTFGDSVHGDDAVRLISGALDLGITLIDTADFYNDGRSEELIGQAIANRRDDVIIATKVGMPFEGHGGGLSASWITAAADASLRRLGVETIDVYQAHVPDPKVPVEETLQAFDALVRSGKVCHIGCSNHSAPQLREAVALSEGSGLAAYECVQPKWNLVDGLDDPDLEAECLDLDIGVLAHSVLASGILTGKYRRGEAPPPGTRAAERSRVAARITDDKLAAVERLRPWVGAHDRTLGELALAWVLAHEVVSSVLVGARTLEQLSTNLAALDWDLSDQELAEVAALAEINRAPDPR